jgi:hypothetical protein
MKFLSLDKGFQKGVILFIMIINIHKNVFNWEIKRAALTIDSPHLFISSANSQLAMVYP